VKAATAMTLTRIIHDGSSRNRAVALRDRHANPRLQQKCSRIMRAKDDAVMKWQH